VVNLLQTATRENFICFVHLFKLNILESALINIIYVPITRTITKYLPQHPVLKLPLVMFFPKTASSTSIATHNNRKNYDFQYLNCQVSWLTFT